KAGCSEAFCASGLFGPAARLWEHHGIRFFWNPVFEYREQPDPRPSREILNHWIWDQATPNPLYWRHPTLGVTRGEIDALRIPYVSWPTWGSWYPRADSPRYTQEQLETLIDDWGVSLAHVYPTYVG